MSIFSRIFSFIATCKLAEKALSKYGHAWPIYEQLFTKFEASRHLDIMNRDGCWWWPPHSGLFVTSLVINDHWLQGSALLLCDYAAQACCEVINISVVILLPQ